MKLYFFDNYFFTFWLFSLGIDILNDLPPVNRNHNLHKTISWIEKLKNLLQQNHPYSILFLYLITSSRECYPL